MTKNQGLKPAGIRRLRLSASLSCLDKLALSRKRRTLLASLVLGEFLGLDAAFLRRAAAVVRQRRDVFNGLDGHAGGLQGGDRRLAARAGALDADLDLLQTELARLVGGHLGGALGGERRALA